MLGRKRPTKRSTNHRRQGKTNAVHRDLHSKTILDLAARSSSQRRPAREAPRNADQPQPPRRTLTRERPSPPGTRPDSPGSFMIYGPRRTLSTSDRRS
jgi:hypothetical protein